ncbi:hypothetical protein [Brasilonema bromeliae]|uniref:hypothetical protein n=1 Tax=Brasilonema bromeliae TaxID=383615 RepID=UPI00145CFCA1|nr:hypothetical protein [Brasilonema bromeliae]
MSKDYQNFIELQEFFGVDAFESLDVETLATLSADALFHLQSLIMQALAKKMESKNHVQ